MPRFTHAFTRQPSGSDASGSADRSVPASKASRSPETQPQLLVSNRLRTLRKPVLNPLLQRNRSNPRISFFFQVLCLFPGYEAIRLSSGHCSPPASGQLTHQRLNLLSGVESVTGTIGSRSTSSPRPIIFSHGPSTGAGLASRVRLHQPESTDG